MFRDEIVCLKQVGGNCFGYTNMFFKGGRQMVCVCFQTKLIVEVWGLFGYLFYWK